MVLKISRDLSALDFVPQKKFCQQNSPVGALLNEKFNGPGVRGGGVTDQGDRNISFGAFHIRIKSHHCTLKTFY